ncbi:hypothetical protein GCM10023142_22670 [Anaerocolumna aminovalerica]|uniref:Peptidase C-terminal archaeal/bacterial domain-containing protein n=1 Tax=Anaerocolumna aminovalerica TaxID=1527 RepID=A0A1I5FDT0_9FIRM|nr:pre-peptidase C-terminal domain-containing protein [Anaerocolumna aminovalerica]SFO21471.1 hypothetical protein SAMN04489757_11347 [Anaerocolumna aminovalerica]
MQKVIKGFYSMVLVFFLIIATAKGITVNASQSDGNPLVISEYNFCSYSDGDITVSDTEAVLELIDSSSIIDSQRDNMSHVTSPASVISMESATTITPDAYEPNDTIAQAYPYARTTVLSGNPFIEGYRNSNCHVEGDRDFFSISLNAGTTYDVVLKNLYNEDRHIYVWQDNGDGTWSRWKKSNAVAGQPEYYKIKPSVSGIYYIEISGGNPEALHYFFSVAQTGTVNTDLWPGGTTTPPSGFLSLGTFTRTPVSYSIGSKRIYSTSKLELKIPKNGNTDRAQGTVTFIGTSSSYTFDFANAVNEITTFNLSSIPEGTYRIEVYGYAFGTSGQATVQYRFTY